MEQELISKKDLLQITGISYGQLYRWKRKRLIPEEWFIKKSAFTGQETFFPKEKILSRIKVILDAKEELSLDDLANTFSATPTINKININTIIDRNIVTDIIVNNYKELLNLEEEVDIRNVVLLTLINKFLCEGLLSKNEAEDCVLLLNKEYENISEENYNLLFIRKLGVAIIIIGKEKVILDENCKVIYSINIKEYIGKLIIELFGGSK